MIDKYIDLNNSSKEFILNELNNITKDKNVIKRCKKEIDILFDKGILFMIEYLYIFKKVNNHIKYYFEGFENNLLLLYILGISEVDPVKYNLPYNFFELSKNNTLNVSIANSFPCDLINTIHIIQNDIRLFKGYFVKTDDEMLNEFLADHYLIIPSSSLPYNITFKYSEDDMPELNILSTVEDYRDYIKDYLTIKIAYKLPIFDNKVDMEHSLKTKFEKDLSKTIKPSLFSHYVKIISMSHGTNLWNNNQDILFKKNKIDINSIISNREDIFEYLVNHSIEDDIAIDIIRKINKAKTKRSDKTWFKYVRIMKEHNCEDIFIDIISNIIFVSGRGRAVSEVLYSLDENNYYDD